ncbi:MAG TPA: hypothetical protein VLA93_02685 [Pyrinomonadaceae bacterium]|nr:hypothetical protein [Pyrinomonadaceae bacterium]
MKRIRSVHHAALRDFKDKTIKTAASLLTVCLLASSFPMRVALGQTRKPKPKPTPKIGKIFIVSPKTRPLAVQGGSIPLRYNVNDPDITSIKIKVGNDNGDSDSGTAGLSNALVYLFEGTNTIELLGFKGSTLDPEAKEILTAECLSQCISNVRPPGGMVQSLTGGTPPAQGQMAPAPVAAKNIGLLLPGDGTVTDAATFEPIIIVQEKSGITRLIIDVSQNNDLIDSKNETKIKYQDGIALLRPKLKIKGGVNDIHVFDPLHSGQQFESNAQLKCEGSKCGTSDGSVAVVTPTEGPSPAASPASSPSTQGGQSNAANPQKGSIHVTTPTGEVKYVDDTSIPLRLTVDPKPDPKNNVKSIFVTVTTDKAPVVQPGGAKDVTYPTDDPKKAAELTTNVKVDKGPNKILVYDPTRPDDERHSITLNCDGKKCEVPAVTAEKPKIKVEKPKKGSKEAEVVDTGRVDSYLTIAKDSKIENLQYTVYNGETVHTSEKFPVPAADGTDPIPMRIPVAILKGSNTIRFFDAANPGSNEDTASTVVICTGALCPTDYLIAEYPSSGQNSRVIVGLEQAGGSSADSKTSPVLDLFFMTPFIFNRGKKCGDEPAANASYEERKKYSDCREENVERKLLPRFGFWGDIRLAATPEQIAAAQVFPTNLVNQVTTPGNSVNLVQSFDFMAGLEGRVITANGNFLSLIPGIRQRTSLYLAFGGGAISPLNASRQTAQIFKIPVVGDPQRDEFIERFGEPPATTPAKEFVGIVPLDRDRFFRQWYFGVRLKTLYCADEDCKGYKNSFPSIVDFMIGQNEAVTGGSRKAGGTPDPKNPDKLIGQKNSYVLRIDGFYPLPIRKASFLFLYGTALMKIGGGGAKITTPLFLDNPGTTIELSDTRVYIPPLNLLKLQQPDRDYYKLGVGINLTDLFNRNKPQPQ